MIVWLASYPRSGNTFVRVLLHHAFGLKTADRYVPSIGTIHDQPSIELASLMGYQGHDSLTSLAKSDETFFVKTHELPTDDYPAIYIVRDGRDAMTSYAHFYLTFEKPCKPEEYQKQFRQTLRNFIVTDHHFGGWSNHVVKWTTRKAPTAMVRYRDLVAAPIEQLTRALHKIGLGHVAPNSRNVPSFDELKTVFPSFFRRGKVGSHSDEMNAELEQLFWQRHSAAMKIIGLEKKSSSQAA